MASSASMPEKKISVAEYFQRPETMQPMELVWGRVREPPAPLFGHQAVVTTLGSTLYQLAHGRFGIVCVAPVDVVLDEVRGLVVQPDVVFVSNERRAIIRDRVWGAPDLVVEILSRRTATRDRTVKTAWYRRYGVRECWLADRERRAIEVADLQSVTVPQLFTGEQPMRSSVLPEWRVSVADLFR
jgi:Uma2 family endonuclease